MRILRTVADAVAFREELARLSRTLALVPTMGFLHDGHVSLMREGKRRADIVVATLFVNPTQFGPNEDLSRYPRDFDGDVKKCETAQVAAVFAPQPSDMYPPGHQTSVEVVDISRRWEGERRPGHFRGVATVVTKLLTLFRPQVALFGEKDFQQLQVIRALNRDLHLGAQIVGMPTIRDADGLAQSSRNSYLSAEERKEALTLSAGLRAAQRAFVQGERNPQVLLETARRTLSPLLREDYLALVDGETLEPLKQPTGNARLLVAAFAGKTRLIDNLPLDPGSGTTT